MITLQTEHIRVVAEPLTQAAFAPFGDVVANPRPDVLPASYDAHSQSLPKTAVSANQGSAIQYRSASRIRNLLHQAPSRKSEPIMSVFVCGARPLARSTEGEETFTVSVMERHPFTTQTFTPIASSASSYLVVVAPSLQPSEQDEGLPVPNGEGLPGRGLPDVRNLRAFIATNKQAVTYGAGTWHSPMVVLGAEGTTLDFVVSQFASGEADEDCQLVEFSKDPIVRLRRRLERL
ncbi:ureidoglycolate lyase domain-containing protein [Sarocladium implicatum]|nr:ureidoglycolate lyase domain-containing protein [Sarocladium implicatum]